MTKWTLTTKRECEMSWHLPYRYQWDDGTRHQWPPPLDSQGYVDLMEDDECQVLHATWEPYAIVGGIILCIVGALCFAAIANGHEPPDNQPFPPPPPPPGKASPAQPTVEQRLAKLETEVFGDPVAKAKEAAKEAECVEYSLATYLLKRPTIRALAKESMQDGVLTKGEFAAMDECNRKERAAEDAKEFDATKAEFIRILESYK
jgi:hypothetical protein